MRNFKLIIRYQGTCYTGWQKTGCGSSIEEKVEECLSLLVRHPVSIDAASRTDRGVHAEGQVIRFFSDTQLECSDILYRMNQLLPKDIAVCSIERVSDDFHPTLDALSKQYSYEICSGSVQLPFARFTSWHFSHPLDLSSMRKAAKSLLGTHDFSTFCNERSLWDRNPICTLSEIEIIELLDHRIRIVLYADHFLYKMARNLSGFLAYVGCGKIREDAASRILGSCDRKQAGITAPAHGLTLQKVYYKK